MGIWRVALFGVVVAIAIVVHYRGDAPSAPSATVAARTVPGIELPASPGVGSSRAAAVDALRLEGLVLDDEDRPVGGVTIHVVDSRRGAISGPDGSFAIANLPANAYTLYATHDVYFADDTHMNLTATSDPIMLHVTRGRAIALEVTDADGGTPIEGALISDGRRTAVTDDEGHARLRGVPPGTGTVDVSAPEHGPLRVSILAGGELTVALARGAPLSGTVVDPDGKPVPYPDVEIEGRQWSGIVHGNAAGAWSIPALARDTYFLTASSDRFDEADAQAVKLDGMHPRSQVVVHVAAGGEIIGSVVDRAGTPIAGARVTANAGSYEPITTTSDARGRFSLLGMPLASFQVWAAAGERASARSDASFWPGSKDTRVELRLVVEPSRLTGVVVDRAGEPVAGARVTATDSRTALEDRTDGGGRFELTAPSGAYTVVANPPIGSPWNAPKAQVHPGDPAVTLTLP